MNGEILSALDCAKQMTGSVNELVNLIKGSLDMFVKMLILSNVLSMVLVVLLVITIVKKSRG